LKIFIGTPTWLPIQRKPSRMSLVAEDIFEFWKERLQFISQSTAAEEIRNNISI
jgi:hypothetical protein